MITPSLFSTRQAVWFLAGLLLVGEGWWVVRERQSALRAAVVLAAGRQERDRLTQLAPAPTAETEQAIQGELTDAARRLTMLRAGWRQSADAPEASAAAGGPVDAYVEIAMFVSQTRARGVDAQVGLRADEFFGFATHRQQGPSAGIAPVVRRQCREVQHLLRILFETKPEALLGVQRERPVPPEYRSSRAAAGRTPDRAEDPGDFFEWPDRLHLDVAGQVESDALRLEFAGPTSVLRAFLNQVAGDDWPVVVRRVEVSPMESRAGRPVLAPDAGRWLTQDQPSRFAVVLEFVRLAGETGKTAP